MRQLWTPWRLDWVSGEAETPEGCLFCWLRDGPATLDRERLILVRGKLNLAVINRYPYNNGHLMIAPFEHVGDLESAAPAQLEEMIRMAREGQRILARAYDAHGFNVGMNLGAAAGAGVPDHQHLHIVPRWRGDTNFMAATGSTRVVPELPEQTWERLRPAFDELRFD